MLTLVINVIIHQTLVCDNLSVLCLLQAALRKISSSLGAEGLQGIDAAELVEPRLLDSFLIYSSRQESYV